MSKHFEKSKLVNKLPIDDPECVYVNSMMEMSSEVLRDIYKSGESYDKLHGVVPKCKIPNDYPYGRGKILNMKYSIYDSMENKNVNSINQKSLISGSNIKMDIDDISSINEKKNTAIDIVSQDIRLSSDEDDDQENDENHIDNNNEIINNSKRDSEKIFETLNKCSSKLPRVESLNIFRKHYANGKNDGNNTENNQNSKKEPSDDASCTGDTEPFEDSNESVKANQQDLINFIDMMSSSKPEIKIDIFKPMYNAINRKRQAIKMKKEEEMVSKPKIARFSVEKVKDAMELRIKIIPDLAKEFNFKMSVEAMKKKQLSKESSKSSNSSMRPNFVTQESLPFTKSENPIKKENKCNEKISASSNTQQLFSGTKTGMEINVNKKPQATAKQILPQSTNYSNYSNNTKLVVVTGKINKAPSSLHNTNSNTNTPLPHQSNQHKTPQTSKSINIKDQNSRNFNPNENEEDELKVVQGLIAIEKLRTSVKMEFMNRMRALDTDKWLREADGHRENAESVKGNLEYQPMIILAVRKYLIYNYSLDVKEQSKKCHDTYLLNADFVSSIAVNLNQIYKNHMSQITDPNSPRLWNLNLIRWFSVTLCMKLRAILQYRAFRNVASLCKSLHTKLRNHGIIDNDGRTSVLLTDNNQSISPFSVLSSYSPGRNSTRNSSPRVTTPINQRSIANNTSGMNSGLTLTVEMKTELQKYIEKTRIVNNAYNDWMMAEVNHAKYCGKSPRHEEAWKDIEWRIIEKTGGIAINSIDESMPFVIKYLEGFINYMNEFQKRVVPPQSSDSLMIS